MKNTVIIRYKYILKNLVSSQRSEKYIKIHFPELWNHINERYCVGQVNEELSWSEKMYWFENDLQSHPVCKTCGRPTKFGFIQIQCKNQYQDYCSQKCCNANKCKISELPSR